MSRRPQEPFVAEIYSAHEWQGMSLPMPVLTNHVVAIVAVGRQDYVVRDYGPDRGAVVEHHWWPHRPLRQ